MTGQAREEEEEEEEVILLYFLLVLRDSHPSSCKSFVTDPGSLE